MKKDFPSLPPLSATTFGTSKELFHAELSMPLAETRWRNCDADADREAPLGQGDHFAWVAQHHIPLLFAPRLHRCLAVSSRLGLRSREVRPGM